MGEIEGQVAFITGAGRGQGRSHAVALAEAGADIVGLDLCHDIETVSYPMATADDLEETVRLVEARGRRMLARQADVRDLDVPSAVVADAVAEFGRLDIVLANAGIAPGYGLRKDPATTWGNVIAVNLTGVWNTTWATKQALIDGHRGGSIIITSSTMGLKGVPGGLPGGDAYVASKHGLVGLMKALALELAPHSIRVNSIHPTGANTPMVMNDAMQAWMARHAEAAAAGMRNALPVELIEASDISNAVLWLVSDSARYVTGVALPVDAGFTIL